MTDRSANDSIQRVISAKDDDGLEAIVTNDEGVVIDPVFGKIPEDGPRYRDMGWLGASILMMKTQIGIGGLSVPQSFNTLGLIPGIIALTGFAIITTWSNWMIGKFKRNNPGVYGIEDVGKLLFGRLGRELFQGAYLLYYIFVGGSAFISVATGLDALSDHGVCNAVFIGVAAACGFFLASIETLSKISWIAWCGIFSILVSIFTLTVSVGVQNRPAAAPQFGPWSSDWKLVGNPKFAEAMSAIAAIIFSFSGTAAFFPIAAEMKDERNYFKAMYLCQAVVYVVYLVIGIVVYYFCGSYVTSPALGSAGPVLKKICYGIALPGLLVTTTIVCHLPAKSLFVRSLRGSQHLTTRTRTHWMVWFSCVFSVIIIGYVIASAIPAFNGLVSLIGAVLGTPICITAYGAMWFYDNWQFRRRADRGTWWIVGAGWAAFVTIVGFYCMVAGTYGAVKDVEDLYASSNFKSCNETRNGL
ncbi:hypothetical protein M409DRAFT_67845 [Zasmidium cellare ATCC 36951]|uniref:Amino acid transporter transmembrane domain-containing protein n=1 Tax=Zasmidium cellare ATCC 36951 TaxID=1080233 RepID=A0A6A6CDJ1_ZASCE|nr:uncharacterized protein M409DRAFT_67845 [Zasmidium cellare ATCC 36951]KAF2164280.1 hypothetical protein M409DRAFT_67845 [Zasmidium cellare ATCC 36951]